LKYPYFRHYFTYQTVMVDGRPTRGGPVSDIKGDRMLLARAGSLYPPTKVWDPN